MFLFDSAFWKVNWFMQITALGKIPEHGFSRIKLKDFNQGDFQTKKDFWKCMLKFWERNFQTLVFI